MFSTRINNLILTLSAVLLFNACAYKQQETPMEIPTIPVEDFFKNPEKTSYSISPDGSKIAFMAPVNQRLNVFVQPVSGGEVKQLTNESQRDIAGFTWKGDDYILFMKDKDGDENYALYGTHVDQINPTGYTNFPNVKTMFIDKLKEDSFNVIIGMNRRNPEIFDAYRLNIKTKELTLIAKNPGHISSWLTDHNGQVRLATTTDGVNTSLLYRAHETDSTWDTVITTNFKESFSPQFFEFDNSAVVYGVSNIGRDKSALVRFDLKTGKEIEVLYTNEENDISGAAFSEKRKVLTSVYWIGEKLNRHAFDPWVANIYRRLEELLPNYEIHLVSTDDDETKYVVRTTSDRTRGSYYIFDAVTEELTKLADLSPWLDEKHMAEMKPITYTSRDGLKIHGYLTVPKGVEAKNLPVVVNPHGGPWARDVWGFNPEVQFLANRGYAVLQMNFRGSTSYGRKFWEASFKQWGQAMQNDISDGVRYLVQEGIADQNKIAIYGGSYGGYATLAGVTYTPDLYTCAIDYVGVSNLFTFMETIPPYWTQYLDMLYEMVGHPEQDKEMLAKYSPSLHADQITTPLFIAQGAQDPRVKQSESDQMVEALRKRGVEVDYMLKTNEGHGFRNEENRFEFYRAMEKFLNDHMH